MDMDLDMIDIFESQEVPEVEESVADNNVEEESTDLYKIDICDVFIKSEKERRKITLEDLTRLSMKFIKANHSRGDILNGVELLRFLVHKIGFPEKKIKRRMYDVLQVLAGCGILKRINRKMFFVAID